MQVGTSPKWLYSIGSHQETHVFLFDFTTTLEILWSFFKQKHENQLWQDAEIVFYPEAPRSSNICDGTKPFIIRFLCQKVGEPFPFPWFAVGYAPQALHVTYRLCMEPIHQSFRKLRQEMEAAGPQKASPFPLGGGKRASSAWRRGKKTHMFEQTEAGYGDYSVFPSFFLLNHVCLFAKWEFCWFFSITDKDFREPLIQMMLYDWVVTGVATENWHC